jgi:Capsular polysaccharide synthesis protein/Methyltransferase domain
MTLPVWLYWEGVCPEWIQACHRTIFAHAPDVRLLTREAFEQLWDVDRDIDLTRLHVAHRADFIRAFLLARYGGLWIDSDCLVMQSLHPILSAVWEHDFLGHRERSGYVSNGFMGARPGSQIAATYYRRICSILRSKRPLGWISLGGQPLTDLLNTSRVPWYQIECERIQPICWREPGAFFAVKQPTDHERVFDDRAICYMLSNNRIQQHQGACPQQNLLDEGTFFRFLLHKALSEEKPVMPDKRTVPSVQDWQLVPFCLESLRDIAPRRVLDVGVGLGRWDLLIRECCEVQQGRGKREDWQCYLEGIVSTTASGNEHLSTFYNQLHCCDAATFLEKMTAHWDLVIFSGGLPQWSKETAGQALFRALALSDYVLVTTSLADYGHTWRGEGATMEWSLGDLLVHDQVRYIVHNERPGQVHGAFLLSHEDPRRLRQATPIEEVFTKIFQNNRRIRDESVSGPGSSLEQTVEIRQRLPVLFEDLKVRSLLHAGCGDFHWMKHLMLGIEQHIGVDIVQELVEHNQRMLGGSNRTFVKLDITRDSLPQVDLILCRDCLVHFSFQEVFNALRNFKKSQSTYLLTTSFTGARPNTEITTGSWRPLNLQLPPFNLPPPLRVINEKCTEAGGIYADKSLGLWRLQDLVLL